MAFASKAQQRIALNQGSGASTVRSSEVTLKKMGKNVGNKPVGNIPSSGKGGEDTKLTKVKTPPSRPAKLTGTI